jgi:hypothetical protein
MRNANDDGWLSARYGTAAEAGRSEKVGKGGDAMTWNNKAKLLKVLKGELDFLEHGGYRKPSRNPWKANSVFIDSPTCINSSREQKDPSCTECPLMDYVPPEGKTATLPCHHIPLTQDGDTVNSVERWGNQDELEQIVKHWLRRKIRDLQSEALETKHLQAK